MSAPHGVVIRAHPRHEGALVEAIRASDEDLEVVRRCADMAEVSAAARSGVADLAVPVSYTHLTLPTTPYV